MSFQRVSTASPTRSRAFANVASDILSRTPGRRKEGEATDPVRRLSHHENSREAKPWRRWGRNRQEWNKHKGAALGAFDRLFADQRRRAAAARKCKAEAVERLRGDDRLLLAFLLDRYNHLTGELYPTIATMVEETGLGRTFVCESLVRLRQFRFMGWVRRTKTKPDAEGQAGPQLEQTSSAYFFTFDCLVGRARETFHQLLTIGLRKLNPAPATPPKPPEQRWPTNPETRALLEKMRSTLHSANPQSERYP